MGVCLITTLKESVSDSLLLKLGDMVIHFYPNASVRRINIKFSENATLKALGNGYFTNNSGTANLGKTIEVSANTPTDVFVPAGEQDVVFSNKYKINAISFYDVNSTDGFSNETEVDINEFTYGDVFRSIYAYTKYLKGNISLFQGKLNLASIVVRRTGGKDLLEGNLSGFADATELTTLVLTNSMNITGALSSLVKSKTTMRQLQVNSPGISGNINTLSDFVEMRILSLGETGVTGSLSSLSSLTNLAYLNLNNTAITGDTSDLAGLTNLTTFNYANTAITGTWPLT